MKLVDGSAAARASGRDELPGRSHYLTGRNPQGWRKEVRRFARVAFEDVYPGVDLVYYGNQHQLEYDFIVAPGADPQSVRLAFEGARAMRVDADGDLVVQTSTDPVRLRKPLIYQDLDGVRRQVAGGYLLEANHEVTFHVGSYDTTRPLILDPVVVYSTYVLVADAQHVIDSLR